MWDIVSEIQGTAAPHNMYRRCKPVLINSFDTSADWIHDRASLSMSVRKPLLTASGGQPCGFGLNTGMLRLRRQVAVVCNPRENPVSAFSTTHCQSRGRSRALGYFYFFSSVSKGLMKDVEVPTKLHRCEKRQNMSVGEWKVQIYSSHMAFMLAG